MDPERLLKELVDVAREVGVIVRIEPLRLAMHHASGGMVRLNGQTVVLLDAKSPLFDRVLTLADAIASLVAGELPEAMSADARELLDAARARREGRSAVGESRARAVRVLARPKPGLRRARAR